MVEDAKRLVPVFGMVELEQTLSRDPALSLIASAFVLFLFFIPVFASICQTVTFDKIFFLPSKLNGSCLLKSIAEFSNFLRGHGPVTTGTLNYLILFVFFFLTSCFTTDTVFSFSVCFSIGLPKSTPANKNRAPPIRCASSEKELQ